MQLDSEGIQEQNDDQQTESSWEHIFVEEVKELETLLCEFLATQKQAKKENKSTIDLHLQRLKQSAESLKETIDNAVLSVENIVCYMFLRVCDN